MQRPPLRTIARHTLAVLLGAFAGGFMGLYAALALVVARAWAGFYIYAVHDLTDVGFELVLVLLGAAGGAYLAVRAPRRVVRAVLRGLVGLIAGAAVGAVAGLVLGRSDEAVWAGAVMTSAVTLWGVTGFMLRRAPDAPLSFTTLAEASVVGAIAVVAFLLGFQDPTPLEITERAPTPLPAPEAVDQVVFIVGDAGMAKAGRAPLIEALKYDVEHWTTALARDSAVSVVYAGDLVYPVGVRDRTHPLFPQDSSRLWTQVGVVGGPAARRYQTPGLFVTGNHDWGSTTDEAGLQRVLNLSAQLDEARALGYGVSLLPSAGDPGPAVRDVRDNIRFLFLDTHWFLQARMADAREAFLSRLAAALETAGDRHVIIVSHHPYRSAGPHGALIPGHHTPGVAFLLRRCGALVQDLNAPIYDELRQGMKRVFAAARRPPLVYAGGHDHSLQVLERLGDEPGDPTFMLVSGAGSKVSSLGTVPGMLYGASRPGYMMLVFRKDDAVDLFVVAGERGVLTCNAQEASVRDACMVMGANTYDYTYSLTLAAPGATPPDDADAPAEAWWTRDAIPADAPILTADRDLGVPAPAVPVRVLYFEPDSVLTTTGASFLAGRARRILLGDLNRHLWDVPVRLPVLDLGALGDSVAVEELTGGMQTVGIRLEGGNGITYQFRNIVKMVRGLDTRLERAVLHDIVEDQIAAQFPLGAMVVAELVEAVGVLVAKPRPVVMPNDARLGAYRPYFAGRVGWIEERPNELPGDEPGFAGSSKIVGGDELYDKLRENPTHAVDTGKYLRARFVDFLVGDWDRHADNWRWASYDSLGGVRWEPIPRDRDWAFTRSGGLVSRLSPVIFPKYVGYSDRLEPLDRLAKSAYSLDHRLLAGVGQARFEAEARAVQEALPDAVLSAALGILPAPYAALERDRLLRELKARRAQLVEAAGIFHGLLNRTLYLYGLTGGANTVRLEPTDDGRVRVRHFTAALGTTPYFETILDPAATRRVVLFLNPTTDTVERPADLPLEFYVTPPDGQAPTRDY